MLDKGAGFLYSREVNIQHSSRTDEWYTPQYIVDKVLEVLGTVDLDPATSVIANQRIRANRIFTREDNALERTWHPAESIFLNPPGGKTGNKSNTAMFWQYLIRQVETGEVGHAIFLAFSLEAMQTTQKCSKSLLDFPVCVPRKRIRFERPDGSKGKAPSHSNVIVYVPGTIDRTDLFKKAFGELGATK